MKKIIHVNRQFIALNIKDEGQRPQVIVRNGKSGKSTYCSRVEILGPSKLVHGHLKCGARVWIETDSDISMENPMSYEDAKKFSKEIGVIEQQETDDLWLKS